MATVHYLCPSSRSALISGLRNGKRAWAFKLLSFSIRPAPQTCIRSVVRQQKSGWLRQQRRWKMDGSTTRYVPDPEVRGQSPTVEGVQPNRNRSDKRAFLAMGIFLVLLPAVFVYAVRNSEELKVWLWGQWVKDSPKKPNSISQDFWPFKVVSVGRVTDTSYVLTVEPEFEGFLGRLFRFHMKHTYMDSQGCWNDGMWSVDIKEPHVQIARHFTPLPPRNADGPWEGKLRFYIRSFKGGEMSRYLDSLKTGDTIEMRGPHWGFDVKERMGPGAKVVFLAGGTGISPGMQMLREALERDPAARATLLWAVRTSEEIAGLCPMPDKDRRPPANTGWLSWVRGDQRRSTLDRSEDRVSPPNSVTEQLHQMQQRYGERLLIRTATDESAAFFTSSDIHSALIPQMSKSSPAPASPTCLLHSQSMQALTSEKNDWLKLCSCAGGPVVKNILMISGPEGFIKHYAGAKTWRDGEEKQGQVKGIVGQVLMQERSANEWLVLKL